MTHEQIAIATDWLKANKDKITRIRPRIAGNLVRYVPRKGWNTGLDGVIDGAPAMWGYLDSADPIDAVFTALGITVDQPL